MTTHQHTSARLIISSVSRRFRVFMVTYFVLMHFNCYLSVSCNITKVNIYFMYIVCING